MKILVYRYNKGSIQGKNQNILGEDHIQHMVDVYTQFSSYGQRIIEDKVLT
jgi:hypothetical protein